MKGERRHGNNAVAGWLSLPSSESRRTEKEKNEKVGSEEKEGRERVDHLT